MEKENKVAHILKELKIDEEVLNVYPYGSTIYGTADENSDSDYVIVTKSAFLKSGAFKQNAISNKDRTIQGVLYSRTGFIDAINNYDITALECLSLDDDHVLQKKWNFKIQKWDQTVMAKNIISKISSSWYAAKNREEDEDFYYAKKGVYHALRILNFGLQLKESLKVTDFQHCNYIWEDFKLIEDEKFRTSDYIEERDLLMKKLRE